MNPLKKMVTMPWFMREHRWTRAHLSEHLDGELPPEETERARRHLHDCSSCRKLLAALRRTVSGLGGLREPPPPDVAERVVSRMNKEP
ncbi:MAG: zf-HC2 domain-containing protein [Thermoleophilia bacterium]|nr:zf-HC2 domain-containing protein [Thermoleophilia bacterium]